MEPPSTTAESSNCLHMVNWIWSYSPARANASSCTCYWEDIRGTTTGWSCVRGQLQFCMYYQWSGSGDNYLVCLLLTLKRVFWQRLWWCLVQFPIDSRCVVTQFLMHFNTLVGIAVSYRKLSALSVIQVLYLQQTTAAVTVLVFPVRSMLWERLSHFL